MDYGKTEIKIQIINNTNQPQTVSFFDSTDSPDNPIAVQDKYTFNTNTLTGLTSGFVFSVIQNGISSIIQSSNNQVFTNTGSDVCDIINNSGVFPELVFAYDATNIYVYSNNIIFQSITMYSYSELTTSATSTTQNTIGALIYDLGFNSNSGVGVPTALPNIPLWVNVGANNVDGAFNRCGSGLAMPFPGVFRFATILNINVPTTGIYYIGLNVNVFISEQILYWIYINKIRVLRFQPNLMRPNIINYTGIDPAPNSTPILSNMFLIYPIQLNKGDNEFIINDLLSQQPQTNALQGIEIYNNTKAEIQAATNVSDLDIIFTTATQYTLFDSP